MAQPRNLRRGRRPAGRYPLARRSGSVRTRLRVPAAGLSQAVNGHFHFHTCVRVCHASGVRRDNRVGSSTGPFGTLIGRTQHLELRLLLGYFGTFPIDLADKVHSLTNRSPCRRPNVRSPDGRGQTGQPLFAPRLARPGLDRCERSRAAHSSSLKRRTEGQESHMTAGLITYRPRPAHDRGR